MVSWHIPLAISGQLANLSSPVNRSVVFTPKLDAPYSLPFMLPGVLGSISSSRRGSYRVELTLGELTLHVLSMDGIKAPGDMVHLSIGTPIVWADTDGIDAKVVRSSIRLDQV
jgi:hypothetical protein